MAHNIWGYTQPGTYIMDAARHMMGGAPHGGAGRTPVAPAHYTRSAVIDKDSEEYARLRARAVAINDERMGVRPADPTKWRKAALTDQEKFYLWNSQRGCCANIHCRRPLDDHCMTIEHIMPKSKMPAGTWDIRNMTILCGPCNSHKGDRVMPADMEYHASLAASKYVRGAYGR